MRRRTFGADGDPVEAEDVLAGDELGEYRREHPKRPAYRMHFYPDYAAEDYERLVDERNKEWNR